jgi:HK97 family phage prohead protease
MNRLIYKTTQLGSVIDADEKAGIVKGYASVFGNIDSDGDIIMNGAYKKTIQENRNRIKYLYQHDLDKPLGKMLMFEEDQKGLMFEAEVPKTQLGKDVLQLMMAGVITENSVGIMPLQREMKEGYREITEVKLYEVSAVTLAANDQAMILDVKGNVDMEKVAKRYDRIARLIRKGEISDELGYQLEAEIQKLKSYFLDFTNATQPAEIEVTEPVEVKADEAFDPLNYLLKKISN